MSKKMASRQGMVTNTPQSSREQLRGLADNTALADQIVCVAMKYLENDCPPSAIENGHSQNDSFCAVQLLQTYTSTKWYKRDRTLKTSGDNLYNYYPNQNEPAPNFCAIFVWTVWYEAAWCLGGVDGLHDSYLFKSSRAYGGSDQLSMHGGTAIGGKTSIDKAPAKGSAFVRRRDDGGGGGHAGIVSAVTSSGFTTIEGNGVQADKTGQPFETRIYTNTDIAKYDMWFLHVENTPVINADYPREDGRCCTPKTPNDSINPCDNSQKPTGDGWERTNTDIYNQILSVQDAQREQVVAYYATQGIEFSTEYCWNRIKATTTTNDCSTFVCPPGYKKFDATLYPGLNRFRRDGKNFDGSTPTQVDICCVKLPSAIVDNKCPDVTISKTSCTTAIRVSKSTFSANSVPHYSVLYKNVLMGADITGSKYAFQIYGAKKSASSTIAVGIGSALNLPPPTVNKYDDETLETMMPQLSGFGTFSDGNGNLIVIVPEWQSSRLNSLIGNKEHKSLLGSAGYYQINVHGWTGSERNHQELVDAWYIVGEDKNNEGMQAKIPSAIAETANYTPDMYRFDFKSGKTVDVGYGNNSVFPGGNSFSKLLGTNIEFDFIVTSPDAQKLGLLNQIEKLGRKFEKPILIVMKSSFPPFDWLDFVKTVITIASSFAPIVGIPPEIFKIALQAVTTIGDIAQGGNAVNDIIKLAGLVSALLPEDLRGNINDMLKDVAGKEVTDFIESQAKYVNKYLVDGRDFLNKLNTDAVGAMVGLGFNKNAANTMIVDTFGSLTNATIKNFKPNWFDFASNYAKNLGGNFDSGFQQGVNLLSSMESIKSTQSFARYSDSGKFEQDVIANGTALDSVEFQNLLISGLGKTVMAVSPNITLSLAAIMNKTNDILQNGKFDGATNIGEIASIVKVANGFMGNPQDFDRLTLQSLSMRLNGLADKGVTKFVMPPSMTKEQHECWGTELTKCFGITIITPYGNITPPGKTPTNNVPVKYPPCIKIVNDSFKYCPPTTCKTGLSDEFNPSAVYEMRCPEQFSSADTEIMLRGKQQLDSKGEVIYNYTGVLYKERPKVPENARISLKFPDVNGNLQERTIYGLCELVEVPVTPTGSTVKRDGTPIVPTVSTETPVTTQQTPEVQPCAVMYDARVSPGVPDRWYAQIAGQWVEIIDCCPDVKTQTSDCCSETQKSLAQMKLDLAKVVELVGRNQAGEKCPECDLSEIKKLIAEIPKTTQFQYDDELIRKEIRAGFAELRAMIGQIKQYDVSKDLLEIKDLIKAIKIQDCSVISQEIKDLKNFILTQTTVPTVKTTGQTEQPNTDAKYEELKNLILSKNTVYQKDYSSELAQITKELEFLRYQFPITTTTITKEIQTTTDATQKIDLEKLLKEQTDLFTQKINNLEQKLNKPCEECTEIAKLSKSLEEVRQLILSQKPSTNTTTIKEVSNTNDTAEITRLRNELEKWQLKFEQMDEAFRTEIDRSNGATKEDLQLQHNEQIEIYTDLLTKYAAELKTKSAQTETPKITTATPPKISEKPVYKNGECTNCPKVVESHTRTIYEYPPQQTVIQEPCNDCN